MHSMEFKQHRISVTQKKNSLEKLKSVISFMALFCADYIKTSDEQSRISSLSPFISIPAFGNMFNMQCVTAILKLC